MESQSELSPRLAASWINEIVAGSPARVKARALLGLRNLNQEKHMPFTVKRTKIDEALTLQKMLPQFAQLEADETQSPALRVRAANERLRYEQLIKDVFGV